jgi:putative addiction module component (TIGR02574 family)
LIFNRIPVKWSHDRKRPPFAEEALSLPASERAGLARLLVESLEGDPRSDEEVRKELKLRFQNLRSGADTGMTFEQVFGEVR